MNIIRITRPTGEQTGYPLPADIGSGYSIGRDAENCDIALPEDSSLSRSHCTVRVTEEGILLADEGSSNGVWRDGERLSSELMSPGITYSIGQCTLELICEEKESAAASPGEVEPSAEKAPVYIDLAALAAAQAGESSPAHTAEESPAEEHPKKKRLHTAKGGGAAAPRPTLANHAGKGLPMWLKLLALALLAGLGYYLYTVLTAEQEEAPPPPKRRKSSSSSGTSSWTTGSKRRKRGTKHPPRTTAPPPPKSRSPRTKPRRKSPFPMSRSSFRRAPRGRSGSSRNPSKFVWNPPSAAV